MKIQNLETLAVTPKRRIALEIMEAGLEAIDTGKIIRQNVGLYDDGLVLAGEKIAWTSIKRLFVVGIGKCSVEAGAAIEEILGEHVTGGIVLDVHEGKLDRIRSYAGTHPLPTEKNIDATKEIISLLKGVSPDDLVIFVVSGGGSTLLCQPKNLTCRDEALVFKCLTEAGADIRAINTVRKHLSLARGGNLAYYAYPAKITALIFSDVPGDDIGSIASGPTVMDESTVEDAKSVLKRYDPENHCVFAVNELMETPKDASRFKNVRNILAVTNKTALDAMQKRAMELGLNSKIASTELRGEAKDAAMTILNALGSEPDGTVLLYGGETVVTIGKEGGKGGRNQELVLAGLKAIRPGRILLAVASDGKDNTEFAGAVGDTITKENGDKTSLNIEEYLYGHRSYDFFNKTGDFVLMDDTGSNVSDLVIALRTR